MGPCGAEGGKEGWGCSRVLGVVVEE